MDTPSKSLRTLGAVDRPSREQVKWPSKDVRLQTWQAIAVVFVVAVWAIAFSVCAFGTWVVCRGGRAIFNRLAAYWRTSCTAVRNRISP